MKIKGIVFAGGLFGAIAMAPMRAGAANLSVSPNSVSFGTVAAGTTSAPRTVTVSNSSGVAIHVDSVAASNGFSIQSDGCGGGDLAPGASCPVAVTFNPSAAGSVTGQLTIAGGAAHGRSRRARIRRQTVKLAGIAAPEPGFGPTVFVTNPYCNPASSPYCDPTFPGNGNSLTIYDTFGNVAPFDGLSFGPPQSGNPLDFPFGVALDSYGNIFLANYSSNSIFVPNVEVGEGCVIGGGNTEISSPMGDAVIGSLDDICNANNGGGPSRFGSITCFDMCGNPAPVFAPVTGAAYGDSNAGLAYPEGIAIDSAGNLYVANNEGGINGSGSITEYSFAQVESGGNVTPINTIAGTRTELGQPVGIAVDSNDTVYVANNSCGPSTSGCVTEYTAAAIAAAPVDLNTGAKNLAPSLEIVGPDTELNDIAGIAVDSIGFIYVTSFSADPGVGGVNVYYPGATGDIAPIFTIGGSSTGMFAPWGIAVTGAVCPPGSPCF
ncbi:MAG: choice-of-anchor D domain-containing protein [Candidatus Binataceae bacterium]